VHECAVNPDPFQEPDVADPQTGPLVSARGLAKAYGSQGLFQDVGLNLYDGDRLGVIGPNGAGKSTLLRILVGDERPDAGVVSTRKGTRVAYVPQEHPFTGEATVEMALREAVERALPPGPDHAAEAETRLNETLGRVGFEDRDQRASALSGGWQKRLAIAQALITMPDVLLLDEPTNHLDLPGLAWLEDLLRRSRFASLVISHDRWFLQNVATRMVELNRMYPTGTLAADGPYSDFLEARTLFLEGQAQRQETLENKVRRETEWLRRGPKARATKARYRVDAAHQLIDELAEVSARNVVTGAKFDFTGTERRTKRLLVVKDLTKSLGGKPLFADVDFVMTPGTRLGLVGPNGSGKTTLLRVLAGDLEADAGHVEKADSLRVVYFDQKRETLPPGLTLQRAFTADGDAVRYRDQEIHVASWAKRFGFRSDQLTTPVGDLSGGEQARVLIARLVVQPADVLLLDEPTNDLDLSTLEVLEDSLTDFPGAVILVTHDRYLLDRVSTHVLGLDGRGGSAFHGDYLQWEEAQRKETRRLAGAAQAEVVARKDAAARGDKTRAKRLTWQEQKDWETIEARIHAAEAVHVTREAELHSPAIASNAGRLAAAARSADEARHTVETLYARWEELEAKLREEPG
jgi:ATP-binding cassette subfamily F protein uup